jgi:ribonucleoside-diphosphate reductase alpha chain
VIERWWTTAGVDPFDQVEWELRTASIAGERGEVVFEQRDVEIPKFWSQLATNVVASKYFRGPKGSPTRERSVKQLVGRVVRTIAEWGRAGSYFASPADADAFEAELKHLMLHQMASFNSPVWFNIGVPGAKPQASACFINSVEDTMESIMQLAATEARLFKGGSGTGTNLSTIRSSREPLAGGGIASGPVSFMRGYDSFAGAIKSGGTTRRAAKMVILDAGHPDIVDFIRSKAEEEKKAWALIDAGYNGGFNVPGGAYDSISFQNANHSVRVSDEFMHAVEANGQWSTRYVLNGEIADTYKAPDLLHMIADATHICGDPGMQFDTTINRWHTCKNTDRIYASNPCCITGDTRIAVADGRNAVPIRDLVGQTVPVYAWDHAAHRTVIAPMHNISVKRCAARVFRVTLDDGSSFRATDDHLIMLRNGSYRQVKDLKPGDSLNPFHSQVQQRERSRTKRRHVYTGHGWRAQYRWVWEAAYGAEPDGYHIHHRDFDSLNDRLENLELLAAACHEALHREQMLGDNNPARRLMSDEWRAHISEALRGERNPHFGKPHSTRAKEKMRVAASARWSDPEEHAAAADRARAWMEVAREEGRHVGRPAGSRFERCCPACRQNFTTAREEQIFCSHACRYSPLGLSMIGAKGGEARRGRSLSPEHREKLRLSSRAAAHPEEKRRGAEERLRSRCLKAARLLMDAGHQVSLRDWDQLRPTARSLGAAHVPQSASLGRFFHSDEELREHTRLYNHKVVAVEFDGVEDVYDGTVDGHHNFAIVTSDTPSPLAAGASDFSGIFIHNSEFVFLNDTACNLSSINLLKFRTEDGEFDPGAFAHACEVMITAQEILVDNASYPTEKIAQNSYDYRPLGLGYANLGALLMARGVPYDSDAGRAVAGAITALMTGAAYRQSARIASFLGPFAGYERNQESMLEVIALHRAHVDRINENLVKTDLFEAARDSWDEALSFGRAHGFRNSQATVLAPTGCLVGDSLIATDRGLVRLKRLGNPNGSQWQDVSFQVVTDDGVQKATQFYVNGVAPTRIIRTKAGYTIQGTVKHRIKVVDASTGEWIWRRFDEVSPTDVVPLAMNTLIGEPREVALPPLGDLYWTGDPDTRVPRMMTPELAELVGYFMGDGSLHAKGLRFCVAETDLDVVDHLRERVRSLFNLGVHVTRQQGYWEVAVHSVPLTIWWDACGFGKQRPSEDHVGKGYTPTIPDAVLHSNDREVYGAFLRGLYEADGTHIEGVPVFCTGRAGFAQEVRTLLLALGLPTTSKLDTSGWGQSDMHVLRLRNVSFNACFTEQIGFMGRRKRETTATIRSAQSGKRDYIYLEPDLVNELVPTSSPHRNAVMLSLRRHGGVPRERASVIYAESGDDRLGHALGYFYDSVVSNEDGGEQPTFDLSVPANVTYTANGFISHNTIAFMMDCDTTGVEPDIALVKYKTLVGGGVMKIVNQTVPEALRRLGYSPKEVSEIVDHIDRNGTIEGETPLHEEDLPVFDCAFRAANGIRSIHYMGHLRMMAAVQPFLSGAISKTVNVPEDASVDEIERAYLEAWRLGLKAVAIYRDGSKRTQPLSTSLGDSSTGTKTEARPLRRKLPDERQSITHKFSIAGHEGYVTVGMYEEGSPGEIFIVMSKEGSVVSGLMDSFATAISLALQYGVPLRVLVNKFSHTRFEPSGWTNNKEIPIAKSVMDYIFRWLAIKFMPQEDAATVVSNHTSALNGHANGTNGHGSGDALPVSTFLLQEDAPPCSDCGAIMVRNGACYRCLNCGGTSGCS